MMLKLYTLEDGWIAIKLVRRIISHGFAASITIKLDVYN